MKEATGELNMTVVTLIAVAALAALFYFVVWPLVQRMVIQQTCNTYGTGWTAKRMGDIDNTGSGNPKVGKWQCCDSSNNCITVDDDTKTGDGGGEDNGGEGH